MDLEKKLKIIIIIKEKKKKKLSFLFFIQVFIVIVDLDFFVFVLKMLETLNGIKIGFRKKKKLLNWNFPKMLSLQHI